jgi:hypothetical protein
VQIIERTDRQIVMREFGGEVLYSTRPATVRLRCSCGCELLLKTAGRSCPNCGTAYTASGLLVG